MVRAVLAFLLALVLSPGGAAPLPSFQTNDSLSKLTSYLQTNNLFSHRYDEILTRYSAMRGDRPLCINTIYATDRPCIFIAVVSRSAVEHPPKSEYSGYLSGLDLNAIPLPVLDPALILIDERWLDYVLMSVVNHYIYQFRLKNNDFSTQYAEASYQLFLMMRKALGSDKSVASMPAVDTLATKAIGMLTSATDASFQSSEQRFLISGLAPLLEHEIAHLDLSSLYYAGVKAAKQRWDNREINTAEFNKLEVDLRLTEERRADNVALAKAEAMMSAQLAAVPADVSLKSQFARMPMLGISELLQDRAIFVAMDGFRGLKAEDILVEFSFLPCTAARAKRSEAFNEPMKIVRGRRRPLPILSSEEFDAAKKGLIGGLQTHDHNFIRADHINKFVEDNAPQNKFWFLDLGEHLFLLDALVNDDPKRAHNFADPKAYQPIPGTSLRTVVDAARGIAQVEEGVTCPTSSCYVGVMGKRGYLEILGTDQQQVSEVRWMFNVRGTSDQEYIQGLVQMMSFFLAVGPNELGSILPILVDARKPTFACRFGTTYGEAGGRVFYTTSANANGSVYLRIFSAATLSYMQQSASRMDLRDLQKSPSKEALDLVKSLKEGRH
jgi:hypothetical protein